MKNHLISKIENAILNKNHELLQSTINELEFIELKQEFVPVLNYLLLNKNHISHQFITKSIQTLKSPTSIPFIKKAIESSFDYLQYTCSEDHVIAKWFSHALCAIATKEAIDLIVKYSNSENKLIKKEMVYRLSKIL